MIYLNSCYFLQHGQHKLLPTTDSPTISACTTATNLSSLDTPQTFGSLILHNRRMSTLEENLRVAQPEIEPLHLKKNEENEKITKVPINEDVTDNDSVYKKTTVEKAPLKLRNLLKQVRQPSPYLS